VELAFDPWMLGLIPALPAAGALVNGLFGKHLGKQAVSMLGVGSVAMAFLLSLLALLGLASGGEETTSISWTAWEWFRITPEAMLRVGLLCDHLSAVMLLVVTGVGSLIHLYSTAYMHEEDDAGYARYFAYLNLFTFSMLVLVLGDSLPVLFVGWEGVGLCSYLLIGFWFKDTANASAGKKAFIVNRVGDFGFLLGMLFIFRAAGTFDFAVLPARTEYLTHAVDFGFFDLSVATLACVCLLVGATGKSAQIPLYVWLPDAMAGPTPVSALIHAATMVTAGVYMVARLHFLFVMSPAAMALVALVGAATAVFAATIALVQNDIKKVLAYSTVSQLGYMFVGVGVGAFDAGVFHLVTHAFFKACLFLGAGAVIHALHGEQDIRKMGGLAPHLKWTRLTFLASTAAIAGFPGTAGFFSKDEILWKAYASGAAYAWVPYAVYILCLVGAVLTAFYMTRLYLLTFEGKSRVDPHVLEHLHRPAPAMEVPLQILAALALTAGLVGIPHHSLFEHWLHPVFESSASFVGLRHEFTIGTELGFMVLSVLALSIGAFTAYTWYVKEDGRPAADLAARYPRAYELLSARWRVDELYDRIVVRPLGTVARVSFELFDRIVIDTVLVHGTAAVVRFTGAVVRGIQTGAVHTYSFFMVLGLAWTIWAVTTPEAHFTAEIQDGRVRVQASRGPGYEYRWDLDGDRQTNFGGWTPNPQATSSTEVRGVHRLRLEVRSPWGTDDTEQEIR